jgi:hypothetical protein
LKVLQRSPALPGEAGIFSFDDISTSAVSEKLPQVLTKKDFMKLSGYQW